MTIANGVWITAYADPSSVALLLPVPGAKRICGQVVKCLELPNFQPGNIPTCAVTIKGRTGKTMTLDFTACYGKTHESKAEAIAEADNTTPQHADIIHPARHKTPARAGQAYRDSFITARTGGPIAAR